MTDQVLDDLLAREPIFHKPEWGTSRDDYARMTAADFWEVGASGRVYERERVLDGLVARGKVPGDEHWVISDARCCELGDDTFAITYQLDQAGRLSRRLTIWRLTTEGWQALYHQGTLITSA